MPVGFRVSAGNWKYAIGELLLIVVGILIALAASDWQDQRADRRTELSILGELHTALTADLGALEIRRAQFSYIEIRVESLISHLRSGAPYTESLDSDFGTVYGFSRTNLNTAAYQSLKSQGLGLISNDSLRSHVTGVYEQTYSIVEDVLVLEREIIFDVLRPFFLVHFRDLIFNVSATPIDYDAISSNTEFLNLVGYRLSVVQQTQIPILVSSISQIRELIDAIEIELSR
jgi:hypothetical protein